MKGRRGPWTLAVAVALGLSAAPIPAATDEPQEPTPTPAAEPPAEEKPRTEREVRWFGELASWISQPLGLDDVPAAVKNPDDPFRTGVLGMPGGTDLDLRVRAGYVLPGDLGRVLVTYWSHRAQGALESFDPSRFVFGETLALPFFAGFRDDGLADGFRAASIAKTRDLRIDYSRLAFTGKKIEAWWSLGLRRVSHDRSLRAAYFALSPDLPPLVPPVTPGTSPRRDLLPQPDRVNLSSSFEGRGVGMGLDFSVPFGRQVRLEAGAFLAALRGRMSSAYDSQTHLYRCDGPTCGSLGLEILTYPFDEFENPDILAETRQVTLPLGVSSSSLPASATVFDAYVGARWTVWKTLEVFGGFRQSRYEKVGADLRPEAVTLSENGVPNFESVSRTDRSVGYEGYYLGVAYRY